MAFANLRRARVPLYGSAAILLVFFAASAGAQAPATVSAEFKRLLDAETWQLNYQITFKATSSESGKGIMGPLTSQTALNFDATETLPIESRSQGASLSMQKVMKNAAAAGPGLQKALMDVVMQGDNMASWMVVDSALAALGDDVTAEKLTAYAVAAGRKSIGTMTVDYTRESRGDNLVNELGDKFKQTVRTTRRGTGGVVLGSQQITLEVNGATKRLMVILPLTLPTVTDATLTEEIVTTTELPPGSKPAEERTTSMRPLGSTPGQLKVTEAALAFGDGGGVMIDDPIVLQGGKISGQHTTTATYTDAGSPVAGMLVIKYTLTPR